MGKKLLNNYIVLEIQNFLTYLVTHIINIFNHKNATMIEKINIISNFLCFINIFIRYTHHTLEFTLYER
jgi:hypothetical protein